MAIEQESQSVVRYSKKDLITVMSEIGHRSKKDCAEYLEIVLKSITEILEDTKADEVRICIVGFGTFYSKMVSERTYKSFGKAMVVPAHKMAKFKFGKAVKLYLNDKK